MSIQLIGRHEKNARPPRDLLGEELDEMMTADPSVCYLDCDVFSCLSTKRLLQHHPDRTIQVGIAEANGAGIAAGLAATGKTVFFLPPSRVTMLAPRSSPS